VLKQGGSDRPLGQTEPWDSSAQRGASGCEGSAAEGLEAAAASARNATEIIRRTRAAQRDGRVGSSTHSSMPSEWPILGSRLGGRSGPRPLPPGLSHGANCRAETVASQWRDCMCRSSRADNVGDVGCQDSTCHHSDPPSRLGAESMVIRTCACPCCTDLWKQDKLDAV
jgi:hypothetical protein